VQVGFRHACATVEIDCLVHAQAVVVLAGRQLPSPTLAGRWVTVRLEPGL
jgi:hypothetical protein